MHYGWTLWDIKRMTVSERAFWAALVQYKDDLGKWQKENEGANQIRKWREGSGP